LGFQSSPSGALCLQDIKAIYPWQKMGQVSQARATMSLNSFYKPKPPSADIVLRIPNYNYLFSDFDPRSYSSRSFSDDFFTEFRNICEAEINLGNFHLRFMLHKKNRSSVYEATIKKRLENHFKDHYFYFLNKKKKLLIQGGLFLLIGVGVIATSGLLLLRYGSSFLEVILQPPGWFLFWEGLNLMIFSSKKQDNQLYFYKKMKNSKVSFVDEPIDK